MNDGNTATLADGKILARKQDGIGWLTFNQPERRNAVSLAMWEAIAEVAADFGADPAVRVVVMSGAGGKAFASGADISEFDKVRADAAAEADYSRRTGAARQALTDMGKPLIAMIQGYCIGGGLAIALAAELRVASEDSQFGVPAAKLGIAYGLEGLTRLVHLVGPSIAKDIMYTARRLQADEALRIGLVNRVVPAGELEAAVRDIAGTIARNAPLSIATSREVIEQVIDPARRDPDRIAAMSRTCFDSEDYREGRRAFLEKRPPAFQGR